MPENVSADGLRRGPRVRRVVTPAPFSPGRKLLLLSLNAFPLLHLVGTITLATLLSVSAAARFGAGLACFFLLPPLLARLVLATPLPSGQISVPSRAFFRWWATWQFQGVFNRLPWIEETLRLLPGVYSLWLRLWGAKVGRLTLWSPGVRVYDRPLLHVGHDVVIGLDVRIAGHFGGLDEHGTASLTLGAVVIEQGCTIGAGAFLGPGVHLEANQFTEVLFLGTPFVRWRGGERVTLEKS